MSYNRIMSTINLYAREYDDNTQQEEAMSILSRGFPSDESIRIHHHPALEIDLFDGVEGEIWTPAGTRDLKEVQLAIFPPWCIHRFALKQCDGQVCVIQISLDRLKGWIDIQAIRSFFEVQKGCGTFAGYGEFPVDLPSGDSPLEAARYLFWAMRIMELKGCPNMIPDTLAWLGRVIRYTEDHLHEKIPLDSIAREAGRSRSSFSRAFRELSGQSYHSFLMSMRLERAKVLIERGATVTSAALDSGFSDASHLIKNYRSYYGDTPGNVRSGL